MIRKLIVLLSILILIFGWINGDSVAVSDSKLEGVLNIFSSMSLENREYGAIVLDEYLKDMDNGVESLKEDIDIFLNEDQLETLESMGYSLNDVKKELDILKKWTLSERKSLISYIKWGDSDSIRRLVNTAGKSTTAAKPSISLDQKSEKDNVIKESENKLLQVSFKDIGSHKNKEAIVYLTERAIIKGKTAEKFDPDGQLTRAEFVKLIESVLDIKPIEGEELPFKDVDKSSWYYSAVKASFDNKIIKGISDTKFSPESKVTREAMVSIIMRILNEEGITFSMKSGDKDISIYSDREEISAWAIQDMVYGVKYGIIEGRSEFLLSPNDAATRGEAAEIIKKLYNLTRQ